MCNIYMQGEISEDVTATSAPVVPKSLDTKKEVIHPQNILHVNKQPVLMM